ncbi:hypothetical protein PRUPE_3G246100 [Prunus persica]|uniref:Uncharacterized protein n=1 Tax=Prunus persica TaxID=3760 RepID=M5WUH9_PRUPE|nr:hypothetical protein PRUPE_3G246100 [Prunus persica]
MARWWQVSDRSTISLGEIPDGDDIPRRKRSKRSSSSPKLKNINIDDLPDLVLVDILCRLPHNKFSFRCKCVSKRWCAIISDSLFIRHFLCLQSEKYMPIVRTLINYNIKLGLKERSKFTDPVAERSLQSLRSFLPTLSSKLTDLVIDRPSEDKLPVFVHEDLKAVVLETYNDLVLCCAGKYYQRDYCICNPYTQKWVALPPSPQCHKIVVALGFICDPPYYSYYGEEAEFHRKEATQQRPYLQILRGDLFSSETGEWRVSYVSFPKKFAFHRVNPSTGFAYKGMLFWLGRHRNKGGRAFLFGFDPFDTNNNNHETIDKKCLIEFDEQPAIEGLDGDVSEIECLGVCQGCLRMFNFELRTGSLLVWDFKLPEPADDQMLNGGSNCLILKHRVLMDPRDKLYMDRIKLCVLDPNNKDILYFYRSTHIFVMCNIRTKTWSKIAKETWERSDAPLLPLILHPPWPTPVPTHFPVRGVPQQVGTCSTRHGQCKCN